MFIEKGKSDLTAAAMIRKKKTDGGSQSLLTKRLVEEQSDLRR